LRRVTSGGRGLFRGLHGLRDFPPFGGGISIDDGEVSDYDTTRMVCAPCRHAKSLWLAKRSPDDLMTITNPRILG